MFETERGGFPDAPSTNTGFKCNPLPNIPQPAENHRQVLETQPLVAMKIEKIGE